MLALFLKSSTLPMQFALAKITNTSVEIIDEISDEELLNAQASKTLLLSIDTLLQKNGYSYYHLDAIYVASGPGSYTSARLLVAIVKTIHQLHQSVKVYDCSLLDVLLLMNEQETDGLAIINARRRKYYLRGKIANKILAPQLIDEKQLKEFLRLAKFVNGENLQTTDLAIDAVLEKELSYEFWLEASTEVEDIVLYEPYYLEAVKIG